MELSPGTLLNNRYRIERHLGQGGMGAVYLALDTALETRVAIKANRNPTPDSSTQFMREARLLASLRHPNLPRVIDYFTLDQVQYLVMDYIDGDNLEMRVRLEGFQPVSLVLRWAEQLGSALTYLHTQNPPVVHRDIKPANIKVTVEGTVVLVDFGIAKVSDGSQATANGALGYTPGFAPPEQYGTGGTGPYSDQYSFAATLYAVLTGWKPADSVQRVLGKAALIPPAEANPDIPSHVDAALQRAMSLKPEDRFGSVAEFVRALTNPLYAPTVTPSPAAEPPAPSGRKRLPFPLWAAILAALAGCLLIGTGLTHLLSIWPWRAMPTVTPALATAPPAAQSLAPGSTPAGMIELPTSAGTAIPALPSPTVTETLLPSETPAPSPTPTPNTIGGGGWVVFTSNRGDGETFQLWKMKIGLDNTGKVIPLQLEQLTDNPGDKLQPVWSPDGKQILFVAPGTLPDWGLDVWSIALDGSQATDLSRKKGDDTDPAWSPDGRTIAFTNDGRADKVRQIYFMDPDGKNQRRISFEYVEHSAVWTPDNQWLFYIIAASSHEYFYMRPALEGTATPQPYDRATIFGRLGEVADPSFSPTGERLAYTRVSGKKKDICTVVFTSRGSDLDPLTTTHTDYEPGWSADAKWIVFTSERDGNPEIYIMSTGGTLQTNLTFDPATDLDPNWQPVPVN